MMQQGNAQVCPACGATVQPGEAFCGDCGQTVERARPPRPRACSNCGATLAAGESFCGNCGRTVGGTVTIQPRKARFGAIGVLAMVAVLAVAGGIAWFYYFGTPSWFSQLQIAKWLPAPLAKLLPGGGAAKDVPADESGSATKLPPGGIQEPGGQGQGRGGQEPGGGDVSQRVVRPGTIGSGKEVSGQELDNLVVTKRDTNQTASKSGRKPGPDTGAIDRDQPQIQVQTLTEDHQQIEQKMLQQLKLEMAKKEKELAENKTAGTETTQVVVTRQEPPPAGGGQGKNQPEVKQTFYEGPPRGSIVWSGEVEKGMQVTIEEGLASTGQIQSGSLPGVPCRISVSDASVAVAEAPSPSNDFKRIILRFNKKGRTVVAISWEILH